MPLPPALTQYTAPHPPRSTPNAAVPHRRQAGLRRSYRSGAAQRHIPARPNMTGLPPTDEASQTPHATSAGQHRDPASFPPGPGPAAGKTMNAELHGAGRFALLTLARLGI